METINFAVINTAFDIVMSQNGVTFNNSQINPETGFMVSFAGLEKKLDINQFDRAALAQFISDNEEILSSVANSFVGVWFNPNDNMYYLDISEQISDKEHALRTGMLRDQLAIYDCKNKVVINLPSRQKTGTEYQQKTYINSVVWGLL